MDSYKKDNEALLNRLKRVEGQVKGIQKMVENEKYCGDIMIQISAAKAALEKVGGILLENHMKTCIKDAIHDQRDEKIDELINIMLKFTK